MKTCIALVLFSSAVFLPPTLLAQARPEPTPTQLQPGAMEDYFRCRDRAKGWTCETQEERDRLSMRELDARILELEKCYGTYLPREEWRLPTDPETQLKHYAKKGTCRTCCLLKRFT
jgi:hypothetical protein